MDTTTETRVAKVLTPYGGFRATVLHLVPGDLRRPEVPESDVAECGHCRRSWDDGQSTGMTPAPSGRCPFEYEHERDPHDDDGNHPTPDWQAETQTPDNRVTLTVEFKHEVWATASDETRAALVDSALTRLRCHMLVTDATVGRVS